MVFMAFRFWIKKPQYNKPDLKLVQCFNSGPTVAQLHHIMPEILYGVSVFELWLSFDSSVCAG